MIVQYSIMELDGKSKQDANSKSTDESHFLVSCVGDDIAEPASSEKVREQIGELARARESALEGIEIVEAAREALNKIQGLLSRMTELATQAASSELEDIDRTRLQRKFNKLCEEIDCMSSEIISKKRL